MAVYTHLSASEIAQLLLEYSIGSFISSKEITAGVENSNYLLTTTQNTYILTIYEKRVRIEDLPFYLKLMFHLNHHSISCPTPIATKKGDLFTTIKNKPCAIISFLDGQSSSSISNWQLKELGEAMGHMHLASSDFSMRTPNHFSLESWIKLNNQVKPKADSLKPGLAEEINYHLQFIQAQWPKDLPCGIIHGDLFPDNVFFQDNKLSGIIDFYFACYDFLMYDIAICLNAWCFEQGGDFNITKAKLMLTHYHKTRPISEAELNALPVLASGAALRFLLTRLYDWLHQSKDALVKPKDPLEYLQKLRFHHNIKSHTEYGL